MDPESVLAGKVRDLPASPIRRFFDLVSALPDAISLSIGEPDFVTPWSAREAAIFSLEKGATHYTANRGTLELRREIAAYLARRFGVSYDPLTEIIVTVGGSEALDLFCRAALDPGDEVIVPQPCFVSYVPLIDLAGGRAVPAPTEEKDAFCTSAARLEPLVTDRTKALLLGYPANPTGAVLPAAEAARIAELACRRDLFVASDEIYAELSYDGGHTCVAALPGMKERTLLISGFSKAFAMTGWRLGYAAGPAPLVGAMNKIHGYTIMCSSTMAQKAAVEALQSCERQVEDMRRQYNHRRRVIVNRLNDMGLSCFEPRGAFYAFPCIRSTGLSSDEFAERLLSEEKVAVVPGSAFGACGEGYVRCSYATSMELIEEAMRRMAAFVGRVRG